MKRTAGAPLQVTFDPTPEIFATDAQGAFSYPLLRGSRAYLDTATFDEVRFVVSIWHPSGAGSAAAGPSAPALGGKNQTGKTSAKAIDLDRAYVELRASFDPEEDHWTKLAEIEPVVPPYNAGESFDGWIVLPVMGTATAYLLYGCGFEARARLQVRTSAFLVA